ncbi:MAG TPA: hypothetical protein VJT31_27315 [Rugosimonospora sp.]|nr:hypothetical protein [Rugosimonospora sp.]
MTPYEALTTATRLGQIEPGMYADLVGLGGDPLTDIRAAADIRFVMSNGMEYTVDELVAPFEAPAPVPAGGVLPPVPAHPGTAQFWWHDPQ